MPACFQLVREPGGFVAHLYEVDREICQNLEFEYAEDRWAYYWYEIIGFRLATGKSWGEITDHLKSLDRDWTIPLLRIAAYLQEHYKVEAWYQRHK